MKFANYSRRENPSATVAQVSFSDSEVFGAVGASEHRGVPVYAPRGIAYRPREGDRLLLISADGVPVCVGALSTTTNLLSGELMLYSEGGAEIILKNNGEISLNGLIITSDGRIE